MKVLIDVTNTSQVNSNTGIQKFTREFFYEIKKYFQTIPIMFDSSLNVWRGLNKTEEVNLDLNNIKFKIKSGRGVKGSFFKTSGGDTLTGVIPKEAGLFISTEVFKGGSALNLNKLFKECSFIQTLVILHDIIPLEIPNLYHNKLYFYFFKYIRYTLRFNLIVSVSKKSITSLIALFKRFLIALNHDLYIVISPEVSYYNKPNTLSRYKNNYILSISSLEKRKNYVTLLKSILNLWINNYKFKVILVSGLVNVYSHKVRGFIGMLVKKNYPLIFFNSIGEKKLLYLYTKANTLVYPSITEGFGIPLIENRSFKNITISGRGGSLIDSNKQSFLRLTKLNEVFLTKKLLKVIKDDRYCFYIKNELLRLKALGWGGYLIKLLYNM